MSVQIKKNKDNTFELLKYSQMLSSIHTSDPLKETLIKNMDIHHNSTLASSAFFFTSSAFSFQYFLPSFS